MFEVFNESDCGFLLSALEASSIGVGRVDQDGKILEANCVLAKYFGDDTRRSFFSILDPVARAQVAGFLIEANVSRKRLTTLVQANDEMTSVEITLQRQIDGSTSLVTIRNIEAEVDSEREVRLFQAQFRELSEAHLNEERKRSKAELALAAAHIGTWEYHPRTADYVLDNWTRQLVGLPVDGPCEFSRLKLIEKLGDRIPAEDGLRVRAAIEKVLLDPASGFQSAEFRVRTDEGLKHICATGSSFGTGDARFVLGTIVDVTEARENERNAIEAAEHANQMKSTFLANMSHEIRTPLSAILGFTELLGEESLRREDREAFVQIISRNGKSLSRIVDDILDLSKVQAGLLSFDKKHFLVRPLIEDTMGLFSELARGKKLELKCIVQTDLPPLINSDPGRLQQIISNLISNAIKFTENGGVYIEISFLQHDLHVTVRDTGVGLCAGEIERLFKPFSQADSTTSQRHGGTGLGLYLSKQLAAALGGSLTIEKSTPGLGTSFALTLPGLLDAKAALPDDVLPSTASENQNGLAIQSVYSGIQVLLIDDSPDNLLFIRRILERAGIQVTAVNSGIEGIQKCETDHYELIFLDLQMPEFDGFQTAEYLRKSGFKNPIIALSAHVAEDVREQSHVAGFTEFVSKPVNSTALFRMIKKVLGPNSNLAQIH